MNRTPSWHSSLCAARLLPAALLVGIAGALAADSDEYSASAHIESTVFASGQTLTVALRSPSHGALATLHYSFTRGTVVPGNPLLPILLLGNPHFVARVGAIDASGRLEVNALVPPLPPGTFVHLQGFVRGVAGQAWSASEALTLVNDGLPAAYDNGGFLLDPATPPSSSTDVDWADFDRDGHPDVVVGAAGDGESTRLLHGTGGGLFDETDARLPLAARVPALCVEAGDVDGDGFVDLFLGAASAVTAPAPNLLLHNANGQFQVVSTFPAGHGATIDAEFGDVDGDRDLDLVVANRQDGQHPSETPDGVVLYRNQGGLQGGLRGTFVADLAFGGLPGTDPHADGGDVSLGDVDDDGDLDLFVARSQSPGGAQNQLYLNDGLGGFTDVTATALPAVTDNSFEADFADFDGDGDLDLFVANSLSSQPNGVNLLLNQGPIGPGGTPVFADGSASVPSTFGPATKVRVSLDVGDVDRDGDPDVAVGIHMLPDGLGGLGGYTTLLLNQGGRQGGTPATFAVDTSFDPAGLFVGADLAFGDLDGDGDLDLYIANSGDLFQVDFQDRFLINAL